MNEIVKIKGTREGLTMQLDESVDFQEIIQRLAERIADSNGFLDGSSVSIDVGQRNLQPEQISCLRDVMVGNKMTLRRIITSPRPNRAPDTDAPGVERVVQQEAEVRTAGRKKWRSRRSQASGIPEGVASVADAAAVVETAEKRTNAKVKRNDRDDMPVTMVGLQASQMRADIVSDEHTILIQRTIRSGQQVHYHGNVIVLGDVNPGAEIVASGNIIVMGVFRGVAHAGAMGDKTAVVAALRLEPSQLRIADYITRAPEGDVSAMKQSEIARVQDGLVVIEHCQQGFGR
jgi:septum site-determining protein MinC